MSLAAGVTAAIALVVALVAVLLPGSAPPAYAAVLHQAAVNTGAEKSARLDLTGSIGLTVRGQKITAPLSGTGATEFPDRGKLTEVETLFGKPLRQDIVSVGNRVWVRQSNGRWALVPIPPDNASPIDQALAYPAQALKDLTRVGSGYRSLRTTTIGGTSVCQIQLTIPGGSYQAFGNLPEHVSHWTVVVGVSQARLILHQITITGRGVVSVLGIRVPFTYLLQLTLLDFGARVSIEPPASGASSLCAHCNHSPRGPRPSATPGARSGSSTAVPGSGPSAGGSKSPSPSGSTSPSPSPSGSSPAPTKSPSPTPTATSTCQPTAAPAAARSTASPQKPCTT